MTGADGEAALEPVYLRGDRILRVATLVHCAIALAIAPIYETWFIAVPIALLATTMFWACAALLPGSFPTRVVAGISLQAFVALHIFQLHGMPEMHFFFFTSFTLMILYKDWKAMWPGALLIIAQHILFAVLHNSGVKVFFFEEARVGVFKLFFHFGIAIADVAIAGVVAEGLKRRSLAAHRLTQELTAQLAASKRLTAELSHARSRLVQTEKLATAGQLAAGVGHEINNPLAFVVGNLQHLAERFREERATLSRLKDHQDLQDCLDEAAQGAARIANIVRDLKTFSRGDEQPVGPVDVHATLAFSLSMAAPELRYRATVERDFGDVPAVQANETRLGQVFLVLLVNAAQALKEGSAAGNRIVVRTRVDPCGKVRITVSDNGPGIQREHLQRIFDPFFTTKPAGEGTGLGLSIAHSLVSAIGGRLEVESEPGQGASFHVVLPAAASAVQPAAGVRAALLRPAIGPARVLVIDDEPDMPELVARLMGQQVTVVGAQSGRAGLAALAAEPFDLVLCDVMMPDMSGAEVYRTVAREHAGLLPRVVMMTGGAITAESQRFVQGLGDRCLEKPFGADALGALLAGVKARAA